MSEMAFSSFIKHLVSVHVFQSHSSTIVINLQQSLEAVTVHSSLKIFLSSKLFFCVYLKNLWIFQKYTSHVSPCFQFSLIFSFPQVIFAFQNLFPLSEKESGFAVVIKKIKFMFYFHDKVSIEINGFWFILGQCQQADKMLLN